MAAKSVGEIPQTCTVSSNLLDEAKETDAAFNAHMDNLEFDKALDKAWALMSYMNKYIDETKPWTLAKTDPQKAKEVLLELIFALKYTAVWLAPFMPDTAAEIARRLKAGPIEKYAPLFPRIEG
jgi:methionyl-tRNA synthetase